MEKKCCNDGCACENYVSVVENPAKFKFSNQAVATLMMCLQKCLLEQSDIVPILNELDVVVSNGEIVILNPPSFEIPQELVEQLNISVPDEK